MTDNDRMLLVISYLTEPNDHTKITAKKEYIKLFGTMAEIFEEKILDYLPRILNGLNKRLKDGDNALHQAISDTFGALVEFSLKNIIFSEAVR